METLVRQCEDDDDLNMNHIPEVSSYEDYEHLKSKQKSSLAWLLSKAYNNEVPPELFDPYYKDHDGEDRVKPQIVQGLASAELYCLALASIYSDPNYHCLNHHGVIQVLIRKGVFMPDPQDSSLTETVLMQTAPIKMSSHLVIIEAIMTLYIKEVLIPEKVVEVVSRFTSEPDIDDFPADPEEAALFWINKACAEMKGKIGAILNKDGWPPLHYLEDLNDMSDGCSLATLISFYCPDHLNWEQICYNEVMSMADSIFNLQLVQLFCHEKLPYNVCFLSLEDFLYMHPTIRINVLAFLADLMFLFEIRPAPCVAMMVGMIDSELEDQSDSPFQYPDLPTPSEMKMRSLQHSSWIPPHADRDRDNEEEFEDDRVSRRHRSPHRNSNGTSPPKSAATTGTSSRKSRRRQSGPYPLSDDDDELTRYFSAIDIKPELDSPPEIIMVSRTSPNHHKSISAANKFYIPDHRSGKNNRGNRSPENGASSERSSSPAKESHLEYQRIREEAKSSAKIADYFAEISKTAPDISSSTVTRRTNKTTASSEPSPAHQDQYKDSTNHSQTYKVSKTSSNRSTILSNASPLSARSQSKGNLAESSERSDQNEERLLRRLNSELDEVMAVTADVEEGGDPLDKEIASQILSIRMKLEEKRKKIEMERKKDEEVRKNERQSIGKEAFLRVLHKDHNREGSPSDMSQITNSSGGNHTHEASTAMERPSLDEIAANLHSLKERCSAIDGRPKSFIIDSSTSSSSSSPRNFRNSSSNTANKTTSDASTSISQLEADLKLLQELEQGRKQQNHGFVLNESKKDESPNAKFYLHSSRRDSQASQGSANLTGEQELSRFYGQQDTNGLGVQDGMQTTVRRSHWGQPVVPVPSSVGQGLSHWTHVAQPPPRPPSIPQSVDHNYHPQGSPAYPPSQGFELHSNHHQMMSGYHPQIYSPGMPSTMDRSGYAAPPYGHPYGNIPAQNQPMYLQQNGVPPQHQQPYAPYQQATYQHEMGPSPHHPHHNIHPHQGTGPYPMQNSSFNASSEALHHPMQPNTPPFHQGTFAGQGALAEPSVRRQSVTEQNLAAHAQNYDASADKPMKGKTFRLSKSSVLSSENLAAKEPHQHLPMEQSNNVNSNSHSQNNRSANESQNAEGDEELQGNKAFGAFGGTKGFFISFDDEPKVTKPKPPSLKSRAARDTDSSKTPNKPTLRDEDRNNSSERSETNESNRGDYVLNSSATRPADPVSPGVGFVIGGDLVNLDPKSELEMAKKKELIMLQSLKRRADQEAKRLQKEAEIARKREEQKRRCEEQSRKREEERMRRQMILEQYRSKKQQEENEKDGGSAGLGSNTMSGKNSSTINLSKVGRSRPASGSSTKPRPKSLHVNASNALDYTSLDMRPSRITAKTTDDVDSNYSHFGSGSQATTSSATGGSASSRPPSALSSNSLYPQSSIASKTNLTSPHTTMPPSFMSRRGPSSDSASEFGGNSVFSEYTGPKLFVKPTAKSNRGIILNAINVVLAGSVNAETKDKVIQEINASDSKHFLILFRGAGLQFRGIYSYNPDQEEVHKLYGVGPKMINNDMIDNFYKYNSGSKTFAKIQTKHLTVTIDAITIHNNLWQGKRVIPKKDLL